MSTATAAKGMEGAEGAAAKPAPKNRLDRRVLGGERRSCAGAVLNRWHRRHGWQGILARLDDFHHLRFHSILHLRGDRGSVPRQVRRGLGLWRRCLGPLRQVHRADVGMVQLVRLVAGAGHRIWSWSRLHSQSLFRAGCCHQHLANHLARPRSGQGRTDTAHQRDLLYRLDFDAGVLPDPTWRYPAFRARDHAHGCRGAAASDVDRNCSAADG